ncbi:hypothetical protein Y032_0050g1927 [Ancylostoma ceylanicum]|uniref:Uncharacterized protein n=1 Tax=Ancylostoma ceylanicum TaxID=53326 RepID=A0A016UA54_9BILA|nr:hypothetical protein Y032_0050g1927 [Ancylostoma ceylanicum]
MDRENFSFFSFYPFYPVHSLVQLSVSRFMECGLSYPHILNYLAPRPTILDITRCAQSIQVFSSLFRSCPEDLTGGHPLDL